MDQAPGHGPGGPPLYLPLVISISDGLKGIKKMIFLTCYKLIQSHQIHMDWH
jgi:hypothetical protein